MMSQNANLSIVPPPLISMGGLNTGRHAQNSLMSRSSPVPLPLESMTQNWKNGSFLVQIQDTLHNQVITVEFKDGMQVV